MLGVLILNLAVTAGALAISLHICRECSRD